MQNVKRYLSCLLAALLVAGGTQAVLAKDFSDVDNKNFAKNEIDILSDIGIIKGTEDNVFSPDDAVTREQMAALLFRLMLNKSEAGRENTTKFEDLYEPYYNGVISWANASGYLLGTSEVTFEPAGGITLQDAMTMLVRALGQETKGMNEGYPWSYINAAVRLGLDRGLDEIPYTQPLTRAQTAVILYNALVSEYLVGKTTANGVLYYTSTSIIEEVFGYSLANAVLVSTNRYSTIDDTVVKNAYVTLQCTGSDGKTFHMTVPAAELKLEEGADACIGQSFRLVYESQNGKYHVLSAITMSETEDFDTAAVTDNGKTVMIGDTKYTLVQSYSDKLETNNNELILYAYTSDGQLEQISSIEKLQPYLGFYRITMIRDNGEENATRAILRPFRMGVLSVTDGKINLAGGLHEEGLTGGYRNPEKAVSGDSVLYYFNSRTKELEIAKVLDIVSGTVRRITSGTVQIGDTLYTLGNDAAGIPADSLRDSLSLGKNVQAVVYKNAVVAIREGAVVSHASEYLVALDTAQRVYENGSFRYVTTVLVNGERQNVYVNRADVQAGVVYRYTETNGIYTLIGADVKDGVIQTGTGQFVQKDSSLDEIAYSLSGASGTTITLTSRNSFYMQPGKGEVLSSVAGMQDIRFVTDANTVIVVNRNGQLTTRTGVYSSTMQVNDGAQVTAIFKNEVGSVETLRYLYISDGSLGNYDVNASFVRVLAKNGMVLENGHAYAEYTVYNFHTQKIENLLSVSPELVVGQDYRIGSDGTITVEMAEEISRGFVTGFTASTITVDGTTYTLSADVKIVRINERNELVSVPVGDLYLYHVEFVTNRGEIEQILAGSPAGFQTEGLSQTIRIIPDFDIRGLDASTLQLVELRLAGEIVPHEDMTFSITEDGVVQLESPQPFAAGAYSIVFRLGGSAFHVNAVVTAPATSE